MSVSIPNTRRPIPTMVLQESVSIIKDIDEANKGQKFSLHRHNVKFTRILPHTTWWMGIFIAEKNYNNRPYGGHSNYICSQNNWCFTTVSHIAWLVVMSVNKCQSLCLRKRWKYLWDGLPLLCPMINVSHPPGGTRWNPGKC